MRHMADAGSACCDRRREEVEVVGAGAGARARERRQPAAARVRRARSATRRHLAGRRHNNASYTASQPSLVSSGVLLQPPAPLASLRALELSGAPRPPCAVESYIEEAFDGLVNKQICNTYSIITPSQPPRDGCPTAHAQLLLNPEYARLQWICLHFS